MKLKSCMSNKKFSIRCRSLKRALEAEGMICQTARETLKTAFQIGWIGPEELWLQMLDDRNMTSHTYDQPTANQIYANVQIYHPEILQLAQFLRARYPP